MSCPTRNIKKAISPFVYAVDMNTGAKIPREKKWKKVAIPYCKRRRDMI